MKNGYKPLSPSVKSEDHDIIIGQAGQMGMSITPEKRKNNMNNNNNNNKLKANNNIIISDDLPTSPIPQYKHMEILTDHNNKDIITQNNDDMSDTMKGQNGYGHTTVVLHKLHNLQQLAILANNLDTKMRDNVKCGSHGAFIVNMWKFSDMVIYCELYHIGMLRKYQITRSAVIFI